MTTVAVEEDHARHQRWKEDSKLVWSSCLWDMIGWWVQWRPYLEHTGEIRSKEQPVPYYCLHSSFPWRLEQKQTLFEISWKTFHLEAGCPSEPTFLPFLFSFIFFWWGVTIWPMLALDFSSYFPILLSVSIPSVWPFLALRLFLNGFFLIDQYQFRKNKGRSCAFFVFFFILFFCQLVIFLMFEQRTSNSGAIYVTLNKILKRFWVS